MFTVLGSNGFIGWHLVRYLQGEGLRCYSPERNDIPTAYLGDVIDCTGLSADFRTKPFETVESHVCHTLKILRQCRFDSYLFLSSTRVYGVREGIAYEEDVIQSQPLDFGDLYNISKIMGESICFASGKDNVRVVRLSNVYGYDSKSENFIFSLIRDALGNKKIVLNTTLDSSKDYISVDDVVRILPEIAIRGKHKIYNIAYGENITVGKIVNKLSKLTGCSVEVDEKAKKICYPRICVDRIQDEFASIPTCIEQMQNKFAFTPTSILDDLGNLISKYKKEEKRKDDKNR